MIPRGRGLYLEPARINLLPTRKTLPIDRAEDKRTGILVVGQFRIIRLLIPSEKRDCRNGGILTVQKATRTRTLRRPPFLYSLFVRFSVYWNTDRPAGSKLADSTGFLDFPPRAGVDLEKFSSLVSQNSPRRLRPGHYLDFFHPCSRIQGHRRPDSPIRGSSEGDFRSAQALERPGDGCGLYLQPAGICSERLQSRRRQSSYRGMDCLARVSASSRSYRRRGRKPGALANQQGMAP
jgi:hypothetical protein